MWRRRGLAIVVVASVPLVALGAWSAASSIGTKPEPQVVMPPEPVATHSTTTDQGSERAQSSETTRGTAVVSTEDHSVSRGSRATDTPSTTVERGDDRGDDSTSPSTNDGGGARSTTTAGGGQTPTTVDDH